MNQLTKNLIFVYQKFTENFSRVMPCLRNTVSSAIESRDSEKLQTNYVPLSYLEQFSTTNITHQNKK